jgi:hypothetical protein
MSIGLPAARRVPGIPSRLRAEFAGARGNFSENHQQ